MEVIISSISFLLIIIGIAGVFFPALPGLLLSFAGLLLYNYVGVGNIPLMWIIIFAILTLLTIVLGFVIPQQTARKYGGSIWGDIGGFLGMLIGFFQPFPLGFLFGMFAGVFVGEYLYANQHQRALRAVKGTLIGFLYSTVFNFLVGIAMLFVFCYFCFLKIFS